MKEKFKFIIVMLIFGSIGVFVRKISLSSSEIALLRGIIGSIFLICTSFFTKQKISLKSVKQNIKLLVLSGAAIGFNWIFLFQAYKYTTISNATLSYYFAPIFVMILSPIFLKEKLTVLKGCFIITAMIGLFLIVDMGGNETIGSYNHLVGILYGLLAAALYSSVILMNKFMKSMSGFDTTLVQLILGSMVLAPYVLVKEGFTFFSITKDSIIYILILGIIHTGVAYLLYFTSMKEIKGQSIALLSYIDPLSALLIASIFLGESMTGVQIFGGILILASTYLSERI